MTDELARVHLLQMMTDRQTDRRMTTVP